MPNYIRNIVRVVAEDANEVQQIFDSIRTEDRVIDFNKIIPCPEALKEMYSTDLYAERVALWMCRDLMYPAQKKMIIQEFEDLKNKNIELLMQEAKSLLRNILEYGSSSGYRWCIENWGSKWNSFENKQKSENEILFETAWACPVKVLVALSKKYPTAKFECSFADEDIAYNCGSFSIKDGEIIEEYDPEGGSVEAYELAFQFWPERKEDYKLTEKGYEPIED